MDLHINYPSIKLSSKELSAFEKSNLVSLDILTLDVREVCRRTSLDVRVSWRLSKLTRR